MNNYNGIKVLIGIIIIWFFISLWETPARYQISNYKNDKAIILDTSTGETWITKQLGDNLPVFMIPVFYGEKQEEYLPYTPEKSRNKSNIDWYTWFMRNK